MRETPVKPRQASNDLVPETPVTLKQASNHLCSELSVSFSEAQMDSRLRLFTELQDTYLII
jgi:hypothetical protein